jgi:probable HAF family extracellular repeat protein
MEDLTPLLNADTSYAYDVNEAGTIVGIRFAPGGDFRGFSLTEGGVMQDLGRLGATYTYARGINGAGHIVGNSSTDSGNHAFLHRGAGIEDLNHLVNLPGVVLEFAEDINDLGQIAANGSDGHAYLLTPINAPGGLQMNLAPAVGQWRVDGGAWQTSGSPVLNLAVGSHTIEYSEVAGYTRPATETVTIASGRLLQLNRSYTSM